MKNTGAANFDVAENGTLAYTTGGGLPGFSRLLVWVDRAGGEELAVEDPAPYDLPRISPDGTRVAVEVESVDNVDIWVYGLARGTSTRITTDQARDTSPMWTADGSAIVFGSTRDGGGVFMAAADGIGAVTRFAPATFGQGNDILPHAWVPGGDTLVLYVSGGPTTGDMYALTAGAEQADPLFADESLFEAHPAISPNGKSIAYTSNDSGSNEV